ncbi:hypothetical protein B7H23_08905 [Notoacmeibacter marinus]|uniref:Uncharacterized protein n=1 Tax=Notoacmeibacter marinus TaxID=1876515 RepID=A0A231UWK1_9HYPH|nr:hypothetical protein [Notoacmeibacter marinus]OXT00270.1 hypothetical protein B7H23_08905 [Notoacmeibacter marinus]
MRKGRAPIKRLLPILVVWPLVCAASSTLTVLLRNFETLSTASDLIVLHALGGLAAALAWFVLDRFWIARRKRLALRFVLSFILLFGLTVGATAGLFALHFWIYFSQWHEPLSSRIGLYQAVFTSASAIYQYAVLGSRHLIALAFPAAALAALFAARHPRIEAADRIR